MQRIARWLVASGIVAGPLFVSVDRPGCMGARLDKDSISRIVKRCATQADLDPRNLPGHSVRSGHVTAA